MPQTYDSVVTNYPDQEIKPEPLKLDDELRISVENTTYNTLQQALGARDQLDETLDYWNDLDEQMATPNNDPWPDAASVCLPITSSARIDLRARLMAALFVKQPYVIHGLDADANAHQEEVSRYYNSMFYTREFLQAHDDVINLITRDGTAAMLVPWVKRQYEAPMIVAVPVLDEQGQQVLDKNGKKKFRTEKQIKKVTERNHVTPQAVELRDVVLAPASARSIEEADCVFVKVYLNETDLWGMVEAGDCWEDQVLEVLGYNRPGTNELAYDQQGTSTYEMGGLINVADAGNTSVTDKDGLDAALRTNMSFWMVFTKQFDFDGTRRPQRYVGWLHDQSHKLCGMIDYPYWMNRWPLVGFGLFRRANRFYHRGVPELTRGLQEEANALENQGLNLGDLMLQPPRYHKRNVRIDDQDAQWGLSADYEVDNADDVGFLYQGINFPEFTQAMRSDLEGKAKMLVGVATPGQGLPGGSSQGKMSAKATAAWTMSQNVIVDMLAMNIRWSMKEVLDITHHLTLQFGAEDDDDDTAGLVISGGEKLKIPPEILALDYGLDVTGLTGGLDHEEQFQKVMMAYSMLRQDPLVSGDLGKWWYVVKMALENLGRDDIPEIIGTQADATQKQQQMAQQAAEDRQFQLAKAGHAPPGGQGAAPQNGQAGAHPGGPPAPAGAGAGPPPPHP